MTENDQLAARRKKKFNKDISKTEPLNNEIFISWIFDTLKIKVRYNTILQRQEYNDGSGWQNWTDEQDLLWLKVRDAGFEHKDFHTEKLIKEAIAREAYRNKVNPIREYLLNCPKDWTSWSLDHDILFDGIPASPGRLIAEYIDSPMDKAVIGEIFDCWLVGCYLHGVDPEHNQWAGATICPILVGPQGCNKSRFTGWIGQAAGKDYYNESIIDAKEKDARAALAATWIWAADEFSGTMIKSHSETIKNFLSRKVITERLPYAKRTLTLPRLTSFIGTDNEARPLRDTTGNRRFAVIHIERVRLEELQKVLPLDRLWGGAHHLVSIGQTPMLNKSAQNVVNEVNDDAVERDQWTEILLEKLKFDVLGKCTTSEIFASILGVCVADQDQAKKRRLGQILNSVEFKKLGVEQKTERVGEKKIRIWSGCKI